MDISEFLSSEHGMIFIVAGAVVAALALFRIERVKVAEHKWAAGVATGLGKMGVSSAVTNPFADIAAGDLPGAIGAGIHAAEYLKNPKNVGVEIVSVVQTGLADPVIKPLILKLVADIAAGAPASQLQSDLDAAWAASPGASLTTGPIFNDVSKAVQHLQSVVQTVSAVGGSGLSHAADILNSAGLGKLFPLVSMGAQLQAATTPDATAPTPAPSASTATLANTASVTLPPGHTATVSNTATA